MRKYLRRAAWMSLAILFFVTGVGIGVVAFLQAINQEKENPPVVNTTSKPPEQRLKGTQLTNFIPLSKVESLQKIDLTSGEGDEAKPNSTVTVHYTGAVAATGVIFESSIDSGQPISFGLNQVIKGWAEGVPGMKVNGQRRLLIPASMAYGANSPSPDIPANADLVFDITLLDVK